MLPTLPRDISFRFLGAPLPAYLLMGCLLVVPCHGDVLIDTFAESDFTQQGSAATAFYTTQSLSGPGPIALRSNVVVPLTPQAGTVTLTVDAGTYRFTTRNVPDGALLSLGWFGGLQPGVPPSDTDTLLTSDLLPLSPLLDLSGEAAFVFDYVNQGGAPVSFQVFIYDAALDNLTVDQSDIDTLPVGSGRVVLPFGEVFDQVPRSAIGGLGISLIHNLDGGDLTLDFFAATAPVFGDGFESGDVTAWSGAIP